MSFDDRIQPVLEVAAEHAASVDRDGRFPDETIGRSATAHFSVSPSPSRLAGSGPSPRTSSRSLDPWHRGAHRPRWCT